MKQYILILFILIATISYSEKIVVNDDENLLGIQYVYYDTNEELEAKIKEMNEILLEKGYITSRVILEENKILVLGGKIDNIKLEDDSTLFPNIKKFFITSISKDKILNIKDLDDIVSNYNSLSSNNVKIKIYPGKDFMKSDLEIINEYKKQLNAKISLKMGYIDNKLIKSNDISITSNQILGLNDKIYSNFSWLDNFKKINITYDIPILNNKLSLSYAYYLEYKTSRVQNIKHSSDIKIDTRIFDYKLNKLNIENKVSLEYEKEILKETKLSSKIYFDYAVALNHNKILAIPNYPIIINMEPKFVIGFIKYFDYDKWNIATQEMLNFNLISRYYDMNIKMGSSQYLIDKKTAENKYKLYTSYIGVDSSEIELAHSKNILLFSNKLKYNYMTNNFSITPYTKLTLGLTENEFSYGGAIGLDLMYKFLNIRMKYNINNKNTKIFNMQIDFSI